MARFRWLRSRTFIVISVVVVLLVAARVALPYALERFVNNELDGLKGYSGHVADIDVSLWRGAYQIEGLRIVKTGGKVPVPFVSAREIDLSVEWKALLEGSIVAEIELFAPKVNFVTDKQPEQRQTKVDKSWTETVKNLVPFDINRVAIHNGEIHYRDLETEPKVDVFIQKLDATLRNLTNSEDRGGNMYASFDANALAMGSGKIDVKGRVNPYAKHPTFTLALKLDKLELKQVNNFLQAYANIDAEEGALSLDAEFDASGGRFRGYSKVFVDDLKILRWEDEKENFFGKLWEGAAELVGEIFEDQDKDRIATRIPFSGTVEGPDADIWTTVGGIVRNAFLESLRRGLEGHLGGGDKLSKAK
jgi:hypothetical protein